VLLPVRAVARSFTALSDLRITPLVTTVEASATSSWIPPVDSVTVPPPSVSKVPAAACCRLAASGAAVAALSADAARCSALSVRFPSFVVMSAQHHNTHTVNFLVLVSFCSVFGAGFTHWRHARKNIPILAR